MPPRRHLGFIVRAGTADPLTRHAVRHAASDAHQATRVLLTARSGVRQNAAAETPSHHLAAVLLQNIVGGLVFVTFAFPTVTSRGMSSIEEDPVNQPNPVSRRHVAAGAAWAVPTMMIGATVPAIASSNCTASGTPKLTATPPTSSSSNSVTTSWTVPAGINYICFSVTGAGGGGNATRSGGSGGLVTGRLNVTPGEVLSLIVGAGGMRTTSNQGAVGGGGFGKGGDTSSTTTFGGGSGGGGSAILRGTTALVVAGGGGGGSGYAGYEDSTGSWTMTGGIGGQAGAGGQAGSVTLSNSGGITATAPGGSGANGANPGAATATPTFVDPAGGWTVRQNLTTVGLAGGAPSTSGGAGANGVTMTAPGAGSTRSMATGAGGGGYAGGGSGAMIGLETNNPTADGNTRIALAGAGGGGSNFTAATGVTAFTNGVGSNGATSGGTRPPGAIVIYY